MKIGNHYLSIGNSFFHQFEFSSFKLAIVLLILPCSCDDFIDVDLPNTRIVKETVFENGKTATAAMTGIYHEMIWSSGFASGNVSSVTALAGLSADEFDDYSKEINQQDAFYKNALVPTNPYNFRLWGSAFKTIYATNAVIEGLANSKGMSIETKAQLDGEAKFIRAFTNFYLVNLFGDVPLVTSTDYGHNATAARVSAEKIYEQIISDLISAQTQLSDAYISADRVRPNKSTAAALLARVYLYTGNWTNAESQATMVINNTALYSLVPTLETVFLKNSSEAIWQLLPVQPGYNTYEGSIFIINSDPLTSSNTNFALTSFLVNSFEVGDNRLASWIRSFDNGTQVFYFPFKYKIKSDPEVKEHSIVLRLAEQYLIRAEARAQLGSLSGVNSAASDLNIIRNRVGLEDTNATTKDELILAIEHERQLELFTEWGHRWLDLKRSGRANSVLSSEKVNWNTEDILYPIPQSERDNDPNLSQNPGY